MGGGRLTVQPCMSPHSPPPPLLFFLSIFLSFFRSFFLSFFLSPSFWWRPSLMKSLHGIISTTSLHIFSMGGSSGKKKNTSDTGIRAAFCPLNWFPTEERSQQEVAFECKRHISECCMIRNELRLCCEISGFLASEPCL